MYRSLIAVSMLSACLTATALPCGHDGPDPFLSVITEPSVKPVMLHLPEAREMVLLARAGKVAYRDISGRVHLLDQKLATSSLLHKNAGPLFPFSDIDNRFLLTRSPLALIEVATGRLRALPEAGLLKHAGQDGGDLILLSAERLLGSQRWAVQRLHAGGTYFQCSIVLPRSWEWVEGSEYPRGLFREQRRNRYRIHSVDLRSCSWTGTTSWTESIPGTLGETRYFADQDSYATLFVAGDTQVRWETRASCNYFNTGRSNVSFLKSRSPLLISTGADIGVFGLNRSKTVRVPSPSQLPTNPMLYEADDKGTLYLLAPQGSGYTLFDIDVSSVL